MLDESVPIVKEERKRHLLPTPSAEVDGDPGGRGRIVDQYRKVQLPSRDGFGMLWPATRKGRNNVRKEEVEIMVVPSKAVSGFMRGTHRPRERTEARR